MRHPRLLIGSFLAATVLVDLVMLAIGPDVGDPGLSGALACGLWFSQISMAAIWLALGQTPRSLRNTLALFILTRRLIGSFLAATVLVDLVMLAIGPDMGDPGLSGALACALWFSQISMAAIWLALGQTPGPLRITLALLILIAWNANLLGMVVWALDRGATMLFTGMLAGAVVAPLIALRPLGLRVSRRSFSNGAATSLNDRQHLQFSIRYMLGLMTALAVVLGTLKWTVSFELLPLRSLAHFADPEMLILATGRGLVAWTALWAALGNRWTAVRMIVFVAAVVAAYGGLLLSDRSYYYDYDFWFFAWLFSLEALLLFGSLWVFRVAGYRVGIWRTQNEEAAASNGAAEGRATGQ